MPDITPYLFGLWPNAVTAIMQYSEACSVVLQEQQTKYNQLAEDYAALLERYDLDVNPEGK